MIIKSFKLFESLKELTDDLIQHGDLQDIMKELHSVRYDNIGDKLQKIINRFQSDVNYDTPMEWFQNNWNTFMEYFTRQLTPEKFDEIKSNDYQLSMPCECTVESIGDFSDTSSILRLKKDTENVVSDLKEYGLRDIEKLHFINMKLWKCFYHRVHSPISGKVVNLQSVEKRDNFFGNNTLWIVTISSDKGLVYLLLVGELSIQDFNFKIKKGNELKMFDEIGNFDWGSQVVLIYDPTKFKGELNIIEEQKYFVGDEIF